MTLNSFKCICTSAVLLVSPYKLRVHIKLYIKKKIPMFLYTDLCICLKSSCRTFLQCNRFSSFSPFDLTSPSPARSGSILFPLLLPSHPASRNKLPLPLSLQTHDDSKPFQYYSSSLVWNTLKYILVYICLFLCSVHSVVLKPSNNFFTPLHFSTSSKQKGEGGEI